MSLHDQLETIIEKAQKGNVAVFKIDGKIRTVPHPSKNFEAMLVDFGYMGAFCGVYNKDVTTAMLLDDLKETVNI